MILGFESLPFHSADSLEDEGEGVRDDIPEDFLQDAEFIKNEILSGSRKLQIVTRIHQRPRQTPDLLLIISFFKSIL